MNAELQSSVRTLIGVEADLHNTSRALRKAAHVGPMDYVAEADEAQALASLVYGLRHRIEVHTVASAILTAKP